MPNNFFGPIIDYRYSLSLFSVYSFCPYRYINVICTYDRAHDLIRAKFFPQQGVKMNTINVDHKEVYPSKVVCIGRNYADHIAELENETPTQAVIFIKPNSAVTDRLYFNDIDSIHYEGEISFVVNNNHISAVGFGLDLTKRAIQTTLKEAGLPWERAKAFNHSAVFSEFVTFTGDMNHLRLELYINGTLIQQAGTDLMLTKPLDILNEIDSFLTMENGDIMMTGTPKGVGEIHVGDIFEGKIFEHDTLLVQASWVVES
jgi:2-keto-4-pentenoate hydratase/2-oxohepta-3-ene-1,7-dioic acid hydratase in catechol pathway